MTFIWIGDNDNGEWIDSTFIDTSKNSDMREWRLCRNTRTGETYAQLLRAQSSDEEFDRSVMLPRKMTRILESNQ